MCRAKRARLGHGGALHRVAMGNTLALQAPLERGPVEGLLAQELGSRLAYKETLGGGRFLKALRCVASDGPALAKVCMKQQQQSSAAASRRHREGGGRERRPGKAPEDGTAVAVQVVGVAVGCGGGNNSRKALSL